MPLKQVLVYTCDRCQFRGDTSEFKEMKKVIGICRFHPPTLSQQIVPQPPAVIGGAPQMGLANMVNYPPVTANDWCYQFKALGIET